MGTSPTTQSAQLSGAAKDDVVGLNGDFNFTIADLLGNDPGAAAKVNLSSQFFFGNITDYTLPGQISNGIPTLAAQQAYLAAHGITANVVDGKFVSFDIGEHGQDIDYTVQIGNKGTWSVAHVDVAGVPASNHAPTAETYEGNVKEDSAISGHVHGADLDSDTLTYSLNGQAPAGLILNPNGSFSFDAANPAYQRLVEGQEMDVKVSYTVNDGKGGTATSTLTIHVVGTNDAPVAEAVKADANEDGPAIPISAIYSDVDTADTHSFSIDTTGTSSKVTDNHDGTFSYTASGQFEYLAEGESAIDSFTYTVTDNHGEQSTETVTVTVHGQNDKPVSVADVNATMEDASTPITGNVLANDTDVDTSDTHVVKSVDGAAVDAINGTNVPGTYGTLHINSDGTYSYQLDGTKAAVQALAQGETVSETFSYTNVDNHGGESVASLVINISGANDKPVALADTNSGDEDSIIIGSVATNDEDVDHGATLKFKLVGDIPAGLTMNEDGSYSLDTHNPVYRDIHLDDTKDVIATYEVSDEHGASSQATLTITVKGNADLYSGAVTSDTFVKANLSSGSENETSEHFHFNLGLLANEDAFNFSNGKLTITVYGDIDGKNEVASTVDIASADLKDMFGAANDGLVMRFSGTVNNSVDKIDGVNDGYPTDRVTKSGTVDILDSAYADGHIDFDVALSNDIGGGSTVSASMTYDFWM